MEESRPLNADEWAILDWFFDQWPELQVLESALPQERDATVFSADDGYRTLELSWATKPPSRPESPFRGEATAELNGKHFEALLFTDDDGLMLEMIWSPEWPGRLPARDELRPVWSEATPSDD